MNWRKRGDKVLVQIDDALWVDPEKVRFIAFDGNRHIVYLEGMDKEHRLFTSWEPKTVADIINRALEGKALEAERIEKNRERRSKKILQSLFEGPDVPDNG